MFISAISFMPPLEHGDARLDVGLALLRGLVLGVLAQVAELAGALDLLGQLRLQLALERGDLVFESLENPLFHRSKRLTLAHRVASPDAPGVPARDASEPAVTRAITSRRHPLVLACREARGGGDDQPLLLDGWHLLVEAVAIGA